MKFEKVVLTTEEGKFEKNYSEELQFNETKIRFIQNGEEISCFLLADKTPIISIEIIAEKSFPENANILGDAWERSYGDLEWSTETKDRSMPWYFLAFHEDVVWAYGVKVRPAAMCEWRVKNGKVCLTMDVCNGTKGVILGGRTLEVATICYKRYQGIAPFESCVDFCKQMCDDGIPYKKPIYGGNNWYYAYGNSSHEEVVKDSEFIATLSEGLEEKPFMIIDECWAKHSCAGPWDETNEKFPDMKKLADEMKAAGVRPGIWVRPLLYMGVDFPKDWVLSVNEENGGSVLDITNPEAKAYALRCFTTLHNWGYELIKHDFTSYDLFGGFAVDFNGFIKKGDWAFGDRSKTNAEIVVELYKDIRKAAKGSIILGCNTFSHLVAGLVELQRTGDDTSGRDFARTLKMGVNTLAFRMCQHNIFYAVDADCVGITDLIPWEQNSQWLTLVAESRTPLFVSVKSGSVSAEIIEEIKQGFALSISKPTEFKAVDWLETKTPTVWKSGEKILNFKF